MHDKNKKMSVKWQGSQPRSTVNPAVLSSWWLMPIARHHCCPQGYDIGSPDQAVAAIRAIALAGQLDAYSYVVGARAQYGEFALEAESDDGHGKLGYNLVVQRGANFSVIDGFGNKVRKSPEFLLAFNIDPDGVLIPGDRLFLLGIRLSLEHRIRCSSVEIEFKNDVPPPNLSMTMMSLA